MYPPGSKFTRISIKEQTVRSNLLTHRCILTGDVFKSSEVK